MVKAVLSWLGVVLLGGGIVMNLSVKQGEKEARKLDKTETKFGIVQGPPMCEWTASQPDKVIPENKSQSILVEVSNPFEEACETLLTLRAPGFDMSPAREEQKMSIPAGGKGSFAWILTPRRTGTYDLVLADDLNTKIFGVTVTNTFGLTAAQAKVASTAGGIFGPMLTVPWWWDKWRGRKPKKDPQTGEEVKSS